MNASDDSAVSSFNSSATGKQNVRCNCIFTCPWTIMYKMLHYSRPWERVVDGGSCFYFITNRAERKVEKKKEEHRWMHMSGSCNQSIPIQPRVVYFSKALILILMFRAGLVRFRTFRADLFQIHTATFQQSDWIFSPWVGIDNDQN